MLFFYFSRNLRDDEENQFERFESSHYLRSVPGLLHRPDHAR
jgi:hypothetical protein